MKQGVERTVCKSGHHIRLTPVTGTKQGATDGNSAACRNTKDSSDHLPRWTAVIRPPAPRWLASRPLTCVQILGRERRSAVPAGDRWLLLAASVDQGSEVLAFQANPLASAQRS